MALWGIQLYSCRDQLKADYAGVIARLAAMGYQAVETAGYPGSQAKDAKAIYDSHGLKVLSQHSPLPIGDKKNRVIEEALMMGAKYLVTGGPHGGKESYHNLDGIKKCADAYLEASALAAPHGLKIGHHNHDMEMQVIDGKTGIEHFLECTEHRIIWEMDTYWVKVGGQDPAEMLKRFGQHVPLVHIKDGPGVKGKPMLAAGKGIMDFPAILAAAQNAELLCVELDECATDMLEAIEQSLKYLKGISKPKV